MKVLKINFKFKEGTGYILTGKKKELVCAKCGCIHIKYFDEYYKKPYCFNCLLDLNYPTTKDNEKTSYLIHKIEVENGIKV